MLSYKKPDFKLRSPQRNRTYQPISSCNQQNHQLEIEIPSSSSTFSLAEQKFDFFSDSLQTSSSFVSSEMEPNSVHYQEDPYVLFFQFLFEKSFEFLYVVLRWKVLVVFYP